MSSKNCHVCSRDISKPSLVRCQANGCPLQKQGVSASRQALLGILGLGLMIVIATVAISWMAGRSDGNAPRAPIALAGANGGWLGKIVPQRAADADPDSTPAGVDTPDWTAATRVVNFDCSRQLSAARAQVCSHWDLATVDYNLGLVYREALARARNAASLRAAQNAWLAKLDKMAGDRDALIAHYRARLEQLQAAGKAKS